ncbi:hypothetical protein SDC9_138640 [bioreactor metagenome]|uniref:Uncharacterized protein n=1 Tax=bioreactor metagenome TaxID=1076179 RepID=A0A645DQI1_9ZZZZ
MGDGVAEREDSTHSSARRNIQRFHRNRRVERGEAGAEQRRQRSAAAPEFKTVHRDCQPGAVRGEFQRVHLPRVQLPGQKHPVDLPPVAAAGTDLRRELPGFAVQQEVIAVVRHADVFDHPQARFAALFGKAERCFDPQLLQRGILRGMERFESAAGVAQSAVAVPPIPKHGEVAAPACPDRKNQLVVHRAERLAVQKVAPEGEVPGVADCERAVPGIGDPVSQEFDSRSRFDGEGGGAAVDDFILFKRDAANVPPR